MTQRDLAADADVSISFLSQIENDHREPSSALVERIARSLEIPIEFVVWDAILPPQQLDENERAIFDSVKRIVERYADSAGAT